MKGKLNLIAVIAVMLIFGGLVMAQNNEDAEKEVESKMPATDTKSRKMTNAEVSVISEKMLVELTKAKCPLGLNQTIIAGIDDNLVPPYKPVFKSPALTGVFPNTKPFDDPALNRIFAHSFSLKNYKPCEGRACQASLLIKVCNNGRDLWSNDKIYVGSADGEKFVSSFYVGTIWNGNEANQCKNLNIPLNTSILNGLTFLDVVMQDDSTIDYMKLVLNY